MGVKLTSLMLREEHRFEDIWEHGAEERLLYKDG
jgi:hypothetical protein